MAIRAEVSIAHDVYDHVQRQQLAFHLNRQTGKIIRLVSRGSQAFATILRMLMFNILPLLVELVFVLVIFGGLFSWEFLAIQAFAMGLYLVVTYRMTERRAGKFKAMALAY